jgi:hypothetical protein
MATDKIQKCAHLPVFACLEMAKNIAVRCARKRAPRKMKSPAIAGTDRVRNDDGSVSAYLVSEKMTAMLDSAELWARSRFLATIRTES